MLLLLSAPATRCTYIQADESTSSSCRHTHSQPIAAHIRRANSSSKGRIDRTQPRANGLVESGSFRSVSGGRASARATNEQTEAGLPTIYLPISPEKAHSSGPNRRIAISPSQKLDFRPVIIALDLALFARLDVNNARPAPPLTCSPSKRLPLSGAFLFARLGRPSSDLRTCDFDACRTTSAPPTVVLIDPGIVNSSVLPASGPSRLPGPPSSLSNPITLAPPPVIPSQ